MNQETISMGTAECGHVGQVFRTGKCAHCSIAALSDSRGILLAALMGVRGLAETEARLGGSKVWGRAIAEIDRCIKEASL